MFGSLPFLQHGDQNVDLVVSLLHLQNKEQEPVVINDIFGRSSLETWVCPAYSF